MEIRQAISMYLTAKAYNDTEFKVKFENPNKNLDECVAYITYRMYEKAKKQIEEQKNEEHGNKTYGMACTIPSDDEIFALAVQYYIDEDLKVADWNFNDATLISISATTFTDEEKAEMRKKAIQQYQDKVIAEQRMKDEERRKKQAKAKEKKPTNPVLVPDTSEDGEKPKTEKKECEQLSLFWLWDQEIRQSAG